MTMQAPCERCGNMGPDGHHYRHVYVAPGGVTGPLQMDAGEPTPHVGVVAGFPFDPVVRMALINKGILTVDDLRVAEDVIRATNGGVSNGSGKRIAATEAGGGSTPVREPVPGLGNGPADGV